MDDFKNLLDDASQSDITFVFPQEANKTISAHKNILAARCAPMQALLRSGTLAVFLPHVERPSLMQQLPPGMREAYSGVVTIDSIDYATFYALLEFLYTGTSHHPLRHQCFLHSPTQQARSSCKPTGW